MKNYTEKQIMVENYNIKSYIKQWQIKNSIIDYSSLESYNAKFKKEFNNYLNLNNFSEENIKLFTIN